MCFLIAACFALQGVGVERGQGGLHRAADAAAGGIRGLVPGTVHARPGNERRRDGGLCPAAREGKSLFKGV